MSGYGEQTVRKHIVGEHGIQPVIEKVSAIKKFPPPKYVHEARRFLGLTGFFRKLVKKYSFIAKPLTNLLKSKSNPVFTWSKLCCDPILSIYDNADGLFKPVSYYSRHCFITTHPGSRYHSYELEVLAIVESLERFRVYLLGKSFRVITDCSAYIKALSTKSSEVVAESNSSKCMSFVFSEIGFLKSM